MIESALQLNAPLLIEPPPRQEVAPERRPWRPPLFVGLVVAHFVVGVGVLSVRTWADLAYYRDVRYPDSAIMLAVNHLLTTGQLYPDINQPPYQLTPYGPLFYVLMSIPYQFAKTAGLDPTIVLRLFELGLFFACLGAVFAIAKRFGGSNGTALLAVLLAAETFWLGGSSTVVLRPDMVGLPLVLSSVLLRLRTESRRTLVAAAVLAGLALLCKQTFIAWPAAVFLHHLWRRRFASALIWLGVITATVAGVYGIAVLREPLALQHFGGLSHPILEYQHARVEISDAAHRLVAMFFVGGLFFLWRQRDERSGLLLLYAVAAWCVAIMTIPQVGGANNYFYEPLMVSAPFAALVLVRLDRDQRRMSVGLLLVMALLEIKYLQPRTIFAIREGTVTWNSQMNGRTERKREWEKLRAAVAGHHLLSTASEISAWSSIPEVPDPYLNSTLDRAGKWSYAPVIRSLDQGAYEMLVLDAGWPKSRHAFRGLSHWNEDVVAAMARRYAIACTLAGYEVWLPRDDTHLREQLVRVGCEASGSEGRRSGVAVMRSRTSPERRHLLPSLLSTRAGG